MSKKMRTEEMVKAWVSACLSGSYKSESFAANSAHTEGSVLYSYSTPIAWRLSNGIIRLDSRKYSQTTSKLQNYVRRYAPAIEESKKIRG